MLRLRVWEAPGGFAGTHPYMRTVTQRYLPRYLPRSVHPPSPLCAPPQGSLVSISSGGPRRHTVAYRHMQLPTDTCHCTPFHTVPHCCIYHIS